MNKHSPLQLNDIITHIEKWIDDLYFNEKDKKIYNEDGDDEDQQFQNSIIYQDFKKELINLYYQRKENENKISSLKKLKKRLKSHTQIEKQLMEEYSNYRKLNHDIDNEINSIKSEYLSTINNITYGDDDGDEDSWDGNNSSLNNSNNNNNNNNDNNDNNNNNNNSNTNKPNNNQNKDNNNNTNNQSLLNNLIDITNNNYNTNNEYIDNLTENYNISFKKLKIYN